MADDVKAGGDLTEELLSSDSWTDAMVEAAGIPVVDVPLVSVGGGIKIKAGKHALVRFDFRDYLTPVPSNLLATPPSSRLKGWMHDFVFLMGISSVF